MSDSYSHIPSWLKSSPLYKKGEYKKFKPYELPICALRIRDLDDFNKICEVLKFWKFRPALPYEVWECIIPAEEKLGNFIDRESENPFKSYFADFLARPTNSYPSGAIEVGEIECLKYLHESGSELVPLNTLVAVNHNRVDCFIYLVENNVELHSLLFETVVRLDRVEILKYLVENGFKINPDRLMQLPWCKQGARDFLKKLEN